MSSYIGVRCPVCNKKFTEADDIVVCPVCGAPHHRDCYAQQNQCAFVADHLSGKEWRDPASQIPPGEAGGTEMGTCERCGSPNPAEAIFCQVCGFPLTLRGGGKQQPGAPAHGAPGAGQHQWQPPGADVEINAISMAYGGLEPDTEIDGETVRDIASYIGSGSAYYIPRFHLISEVKRAFLPSMSAFFLNFAYFFYRKMYAYGFLLLSLLLVSLIPSFLYFWYYGIPQVFSEFGLGTPVPLDKAVGDHYASLAYVTRLVYLCICLIFSVFSNRVYHARVIAAVHKIRTEAGEGTDYTRRLELAGGTNKLAVIIALAAVAVVYMTVFMMMMSRYLTL